MIINGKNYRIPEINFEEVCLLEEYGVSLFDVKQPKKKFLTIIRAFVSLATGMDTESASFLIQQHILGGGNMDGWFEEINKAVDTSGFFQALNKKAEKKQKSPNPNEEVIENE